MQQMHFVDSYALFVSDRVQQYVQCAQFSRKTVHPRSYYVHTVSYWTQCGSVTVEARGRGEWGGIVALSVMESDALPSKFVEAFLVYFSNISQYSMYRTSAVIWEISHQFCTSPKRGSGDFILSNPSPPDVSVLLKYRRLSVDTSVLKLYVSLFRFMTSCLKDTEIWNSALYPASSVHL